MDDNKPARDTEKAETQVDRDKKCLRIVYTITGGPLASNYYTHSPSASSSKRGKGKEVYHVKRKKLKVDNTITFTDEDFEEVQTLHQDAL